ncbi:MAG: DUF2975 domain-containing protein [Alphaproteobacteria bacterium]|nr:DUF2975 domain-containing protein [Alphaproteobacteria bacterium]
MTVTEIRTRSAGLARALSVLFVVLAVLVALERLSVPLIGLWRFGGGSGAWRRLGVSLVAAVPDAFYLAALWGIRTALAEFATGDFFASTVTAMLDRVGRWLAIGAVVSMFVVPLADTALGHGPGYWVALDVSALVLGAVGLSLTVVGRVLARAAALKTELDGMF